MIVFVAFILLGLTLGVGMMLAPALPTSQPRVAASGVLSLAIVLSGALFHAALFGWDTLLVDYLWFALIMGVFLGGTLTVGMKKIEDSLASGVSLSAGWPTIPAMVIFLGLGITLALVLSVWGNTSAFLEESPQLLARFEAMHQGEDLHQLNNLAGRIGPGTPALLVYFNTQLPSDLSASYAGLVVTAYTLLGWLLYDLGQEVSDNRLGWQFFGTVFLFALLMGLHLVALLATIFVLGFWLFSLRWTRHVLRMDAIAAAICAAAAILVHPITVGVMVALYGVNWFLPHERPTTRWGWGAVLLPSLTLLGLLPWLLTVF